MKRLLCAGALLSLVATAGAAGLDDVLNKACAAGYPWRLPPPPPGHSTSEVPIKINGASGRLVTICNCTADQPGKDTGVWVRTSMSEDKLKDVAAAHKVRIKAKSKELEPGPGTWPYYLPGKSCVHAGSITVMLGPGDSKVETWGTSVIEPAAPPK